MSTNIDGKLMESEQTFMESLSPEIKEHKFWYPKRWKK